MKKESFLEKIIAYFIIIWMIAIIFFDIWLFNVGKISFEDCLLLCITFGVGSIVNTILVTGERIINKINELKRRNNYE